MRFFQDVTQVKFTGLDHIFNVSSVFCEIDLPFMSQPLTIRWYGVIIAFGLTLAVLFGGRKAYKWKIDIFKMIDILIYGSLAGIVGARLYYVAFEWGYYKLHPGEIFQIWNGGLAIYGGLIAGLLAAFVVCKVEKINIPNLLDLCGMSFLIGQGIGRWGNFANQEAFGVNTDLPWGMYSAKTQAYLSELVASGTDLAVDPSKPVHPTFLYESVWCLLGFVVLYIICQKARKFSGQIFLCYGIWYGTRSGGGIAHRFAVYRRYQYTHLAGAQPRTGVRLRGAAGGAPDQIHEEPEAHRGRGLLPRDTFVPLQAQGRRREEGGGKTACRSRKGRGRRRYEKSRRTERKGGKTGQIV